jgi:broad specificity phosphatase PhoE
MASPHEIVLARHGATEWSVDDRHTGRTDIPLTADGCREAERLRGALAGHEFALVLSSPLSRAQETCRLAGFGDRAELTDDLLEWDYGEYEGVTTKQIREGRPDWVLFRDGCPGGETAADVGARVDRVIARLKKLDGDAVLFAHGHLLRVLAARWCELDPAKAQRFALTTGTLSALSWEHEWTVVSRWNAPVCD